MSNPSQPPAGPWSEQDLIADVEAGPKGPHIGAFFDFDGTLIDGYSLSAFARHHLRSLQVTPADLGQLLLTGMPRRDHRGGLRAVHRAEHARLGRAQ